jgi:hypothetical protein
MEPRRRYIAVGTQNTGVNRNLETVGLSFALLSVVASFFAGFLLGEDSVGGARFDSYEFHWPIIERFSVLSWSTAVADYPSATNPLLYILVSLLPFRSNQDTYHRMTFAIAFLTWPLLSWAYYRRYSDRRIDRLWASFGASTILLSPGFRSSAFWGTTDFLPFVFCASTSLLISGFQDSERRHPAIGVLALVAVAITSACAFYTRQFYAFLPVVAAYTVLTRTDTSRFIVVGVFVTMALPELLLIYIWNGFNPPTFHGQFHPGITNVLVVGVMIAFLSTPLFVGCVRRSLADVFPEWWGTRSTVIAFAGLLVFIIVVGATRWPEAGGGIIVKAGLSMGAMGTPFILATSYLGLLAAGVFCMRSITNALLAGSFLLPFFLAFPTYQRYLEPSLVVALFLFSDSQTSRALFNKRVLACNFAFTGLILVLGIAYYDVFHDLPEIK